MKSIAFSLVLFLSLPLLFAQSSYKNAQSLIQPQELIGHRKNAGNYYVIVDGSLFVQNNRNNDPHAIYFKDIVQGNIGNCYFLAKLAAIASVRPTWISHLITEDKSFISQRHGLRAFNVSIPYGNGKKYQVYVSNEFYGRHIVLNEGIHEDISQFFFADYASINSYGPKLEYWVALLEKALAASAHKSYTGIDVRKSYMPTRGLLTGSREKIYRSRFLTEEKIGEILYQHVMVDRLPATINTFGKTIPSAPGFDDNHVMAVVAINEDKNLAHIYDPHGESHYVDLSFLKSRAQTIKLLNFPLQIKELNESFPAIDPPPFPNLLTKYEDPYKNHNRYCSDIDPQTGLLQTENLYIPEKTQLALDYLDNLEIPEKSPHWSFTWQEISSGLKRRLLVPSSIEQAGLATCGPALVASIYLDYKPLQLVKTVANLFLNKEMLYASGKTYEVTQNFCEANHIAFNTQLDEANSYHPIDYLLQGSITNSRPGVPGITTGWQGKPGPGVRSATTIKREAGLIKDIVGLKYVQYVKTPMKNVIDTTKAISEIIEIYGDDVYIGMLMRDREKSFKKIRNIRVNPNHYLRIRSPFNFGSGDILWFDTSKGANLFETTVEARKNTITYSCSTHYSQQFRQVSYDEFIYTTYGFIVATDNPEVFEKYPQINWTIP